MERCDFCELPVGGGCACSLGKDDGTAQATHGNTARVATRRCQSCDV